MDNLIIDSNYLFKNRFILEWNTAQKFYSSFVRNFFHWLNRKKTDNIVSNINCFFYESTTALNAL